MLFSNSRVIVRAALFVIVALVTTAVVCGQTAITVGVSNQARNLSREQILRLRDKVETAISSVSSGDVVTSGLGLLCKVDMTVASLNDYNDGFKTRYSVVLELSLKYVSMIDNTIVHAYQKNCSGTGTDKEQAITSALNTVKSTDTAISGSASQAQFKQTELFKKQCTALLDRATVSVSAGAFEEAAAVALSIPQSAGDCYTRGNRLADSVNKIVSVRECQRIILEAEASAASKEYVDALWKLASVDPLSKCFSDAQKMMKEYGKKLDAADKQKWEQERVLRAEQQKYEDKRLAAVVEMAKAYYKSKQAQYNIIVR